MTFDKVMTMPMAAGDSAALKIGVLIKGSYVTEQNKMKLGMTYVFPLVQLGVATPALLVQLYGTYHPTGKNAVKKDVTAYSSLMLEHIASTSIDTLLVADATYYKYLTGKKKADEYVDDVVPCCIEGYEYLNIIASINYTVLDKSPHKSKDLQKSLSTLAHYLNGTYKKPGSDAMTNYHKPKTVSQAKELLDSWKQHKQLTCDIETTGLRFERDEILTIGFGTDKHTATAFPIHSHYLGEAGSAKMKNMLKEFFNEYLLGTDNRLIFHNALFDLKFLIKALYMNNTNDLDGLNEGLNVFHKTDDSMIEAYLATNSTGFVPLGLKQLSLEYMGDYAEDVKEAIKVPLEDLLEYNAKDCCATSYVHDKYLAIMEEDEQVRPYREIFQPSIKVLLKMMMVGLPIDLDKVAEARATLEETQKEVMNTIRSSSYTERVVNMLKHRAMIKYNETHKTIQKTVDDFDDLEFNPNSSDQLRMLLFDVLGYEPIATTGKGQGKTDRASIVEFKLQAEHDGEDDVAALLDGLIQISQTSIILTTFIAAFEKFAIQHPMFNDDKVMSHWLNGGLKLGGTQCNVASTLFNTDKGIQPYSKLSIGDLVISHDGTINKVTDLFPNGKKPIYEITTENGLVTRCSGEHPFYIQGEWVEAKSLNIGMQLKTLSKGEVWKPIPDYPMYEVSSWGRVYCKFSKSCLTPNEKGDNILSVNLYQNGSPMSSYANKLPIHTLVAKAFLKDCDKTTAGVTHINGCIWDNRVENLTYEHYDNFYPTAVGFMEDTVTSITVLPQEETFGVTIENTHSHVTDGIVTHNSGRLSSNNP